MTCILHLFGAAKRPTLKMLTFVGFFCYHLNKSAKSMQILLFNFSFPYAIYLLVIFSLTQRSHDLQTHEGVPLHTSSQSGTHQTTANISESAGAFVNLSNPNLNSYEGSQDRTNFTHAEFLETTGALANCSNPLSPPLGDEDTIVVSCLSIHFKVDSNVFVSERKWNVVVGILSSSSNVERREVIRSTWATGRSGIFFVVAGLWEDISEEFQTFGDLIWIDTDEEYHKITYKSAAFYAVVNRASAELGTDFEYALKTDDDSYVALDRIDMFLGHLHHDKGIEPDYIGKCNEDVSPIRDSSHKYYTSLEEYPEEKFPTYCQGFGLMVSQSFVRCLTAHHNIGSIRYQKHEDVFIGLLAERCGIKKIQFITEYHLRLFRTGWNHGDSRAIQEERQRIAFNGEPVSEEELPMAEMAARMIQHRIHSDEDMIRHYKSHFDPRLIKSIDEINVGDFIEYYVDDENGWHGADILNISNVESGQEVGAGNYSEWPQVWLYFRFAQEYVVVDYIPFLGTWRKSSRHRKAAIFNNDHDVKNSKKRHGISKATRKRKRENNFNGGNAHYENAANHVSTDGSSTILDGFNITKNEKLFSSKLYQSLEEHFGSPHSSGTSSSCEADSAEEKYIRILKGTMKQTKEKNRATNDKLWDGLHPCPLIFLFYYEETNEEDMNNFVQYYEDFDPQCIKFAVPWDFVDSLEVEAHESKTDFQFILSRARYSDQNKVINDALSEIRKSYGSHCLVSVNDMDHYLVWSFQEARNGLRRFYRYHSYSDAVKLYMYSFLTAPGCGNKNIHEIMVAPCTCLLENNVIHRKLEKPFFSEYGVNNMFHPTMNFFVSPDLVDSVGTVFSNLDLRLDAVAHHTMGDHLPTFNLANTITPAVIHLRKAGGLIDSIERYTEFLDGSKRNKWSSSDGTVGEAIACVQRNPKWLIRKRRFCGKVKEVSNIFASVIQRKKCLEAGIDKFTCTNELPCCVTIATEE